MTDATLTPAARPAGADHSTPKGAAAAPVLLTDEQVIDFIIRGYLMIQPPVDPSVHAQVCREFDRNGVVPVDLEHDPCGDELLVKSPTLNQVFDHPVVHGATLSLLGPDYVIFGRYCHANGPGTGGAFWHQDDINARHYQVRRLMFLYYPQEVTADMGPTYVVPGTHLFNTPTDMMQTYGNIRGQLPLTVPAGTVVLTHYDLWHSASRNRSDRMRYLVKYYVDRRREPTGPAWDHNGEAGTRAAMQRMHFERTAWSNSDYYKERHLRWRLWSYLLGSKGPVAWAKWNEIHPSPRPLGEADPGEIQGYIGSPLI